MLWSAQYDYFPEIDKILDNLGEQPDGSGLERLLVEEGFLQELQNSERLQNL